MNSLYSSVEQRVGSWKHALSSGAVSNNVWHGCWGTRAFRGPHPRGQLSPGSASLLCGTKNKAGLEEPWASYGYFVSSPSPDFPNKQTFWGETGRNEVLVPTYRVHTCWLCDFCGTSEFFSFLLSFQLWGLSAFLQCLLGHFPHQRPFLRSRLSSDPLLNS